MTFYLTAPENTTSDLSIPPSSIPSINQTRSEYGKVAPMCSTPAVQTNRNDRVEWTGVRSTMNVRVGLIRKAATETEYGYG